MIIPAEHDYVTLPEPIAEGTESLIIWSRGDPKYNPQSYSMRVYRVAFGELVEHKAKLEKKEEIIGVPTIYAIAYIENTQRLFLWPAPATDLFAKFRYCPAMKEI